MIATDDARIQAAATGFGAEVIMTAPDHVSGTERIAEVAGLINAPAHSIIVNVQGDEFGLPPALVDQVAGLLMTDDQVHMATLCEPIDRAEDFLDPHVVKVVMDQSGNALYFSRAPIPWNGQGDGSAGGVPGMFRHIGLYAYHAGFLREFAVLPHCVLERIERLEQLRALYNGYRIRVAMACEHGGIGVDCSDDLERARDMVRVAS